MLRMSMWSNVATKRGHCTVVADPWSPASTVMRVASRSKTACALAKSQSNAVADHVNGCESALSRTHCPHNRCLDHASRVAGESAQPLPPAQHHQQSGV